MFYQEYYEFKPKYFDQQGFHVETQQWFLDLIGEFEKDFHYKFPDRYANHLFANHSAMKLIDKAMNLDEVQSSGMDLIDGEVDLDANLEMEEYSETKTVYAIGSRIAEKEDEPIFLVISEKLPNGIVILKYVDDDESDEVQEPVRESVANIIKESNLNYNSLNTDLT